MKHIKLYEDFTESQYNRFNGIDISDIHSISFIWSNVPFFSHYKANTQKDINVDIMVDKTPGLAKEVGKVLSENNVDKNELLSILKNNFDVEESTGGYSVALVGEDVRIFFELIQNINNYK